MPQNTLIIVNVGLFFLMVSSRGEGASLQKTVNRPSDLDLTWVGSALIVDEGVEGGLGPEEGLDAHGGEDLSKQGEMGSIIEGQRCNRCGECGSIQDPKVFLGLKGDGLDVVLSERPIGGKDLTCFGRGRSTNRTDRRVTDQGTGNV